MHKIRGGGGERNSGSEGTITKKKKKRWPEIKAERVKSKGQRGEFKTLKGSFVERESMKAERRSEFGMEHEH